MLDFTCLQSDMISTILAGCISVYTTSVAVASPHSRIGVTQGWTRLRRLENPLRIFYLLLTGILDVHFYVFLTQSMEKPSIMQANASFLKNIFVRVTAHPMIFFVGHKLNTTTGLWLNGGQSMPQLRFVIQHSLKQKEEIHCYWSIKVYEL